MALRFEARDVRALKRERAPATVSKLQLPSTFKRFERKDKENIVPSLEAKPKDIEGTPSKPPCVEPKTGTLKKLKLSEARVMREPVKKNLVKDRSVELFPPSFDADINALLDKKIKAQKFEYALRNTQQTALIKELRDMLIEFVQKKNMFTADCMSYEEKAEAEMESYKRSVSGALTGKELLDEELKSALSTIETNKLALERLQTETATLTEQLAEMTNKSSQLENAARGTERELTLFKTETEELKKNLDFKTDQLDKAREQLEATKRQMAEEQVSARAERATMEKALQERLEAAQLQLFDATRNIETTTKDKSSLAEQVSRLEVSVLKATAEVQRAEEQARQADKASMGLQNQIKNLEEQENVRRAEVKALLDNFSQTQAFNEGHQKEIISELKGQREKVDVLLEAKSRLEGELHAATSSLQDTSRQLQDTSSKLEAVSQELSSERAVWDEARGNWQQREQHLTGELSAAQVSWKEQQAQQNERERQVVLERDEARGKARHALDELLTYQANSGVSNNEQLQSLCKAQMENAFLRQQLEGKDNLALTLVQREADLRDLKDKLYHGEMTRRELHNKIQELRGSIRVIVRVRPFLKHDAEQGPCVVEFHPNGQGVHLLAEDGTPHNFNFDQVFPPASTQENIFDEVSNLVQSALDGFNVCLFSYGQTGSGKTHTMQGALTGPNQGIIPRSIAKVMEEARRLGGQGWTYTFEATYLEIYNEQLRDLLGESRSSTNLDIKMDPNKLESVYVPGLTRLAITEAGQIEALINLATKHRAVAGTDMNEHSSRSHAVFTLFIVGTNKDKDVVLEGSLNLCDLAGSERLSKSGAVGDRLKETQAINKSLSSLGDVFQALQSRSAHIPYRNSKLTYLLSPCFSGQGKTLMFVNLSPLVSSHDESMCSLRFASKVTACELGSKQTKNVKKIATQPSIPSSASTSITSTKRPAPLPAAVRPRPGAR